MRSKNNCVPYLKKWKYSIIHASYAYRLFPKIWFHLEKRSTNLYIYHDVVFSRCSRHSFRRIFLQSFEISHQPTSGCCWHFDWDWIRVVDLGDSGLNLATIWRRFKMKLLRLISWNVNFVKKKVKEFAQMIFVVLLLLSLPDQVPSQSQYKAENSKRTI